MKRSIRFYLLSVTLVAFINGCSGMKSDKISLGDEILADCPDRPNCVFSQAVDPAHAAEPFRFEKDPDEVWNGITSIVGTLPQTRIVKATDRYLHAECKSRLFGFIDDLELQLNISTSVIDIRSASRTGYYDFGVNRRRVSGLRQILMDSKLIQ